MKIHQSDFLNMWVQRGLQALNTFCRAALRQKGFFIFRYDMGPKSQKMHFFQFIQVRPTKIQLVTKNSKFGFYMSIVLFFPYKMQLFQVSIIIIGKKLFARQTLFQLFSPLRRPLPLVTEQTVSFTSCSILVDLQHIQI